MIETITTAAFQVVRMLIVITILAALIGYGYGS